MSATRDLAAVVLRRARSTLVAEWHFLVVIVAASASPGLLALAAPRPVDARVSLAVGSLLNLYLQLLATFRALARSGIEPEGRATRGRYPSAWFASLLSTLGIAAGMILLIVPGVLLLALWSVWMPALSAEHLSAREALARSWFLTRRRLGAVLLIVAVAIGVLLAGALVGVLPTLVADPAGSSVGAVLQEFTVALCLMAAPFLWAATYVELRRDLPSEGEMAPA